MTHLFSANSHIMLHGTLSVFQVRYKNANPGDIAKEQLPGAVMQL